jgi:CBS domain-containing protein
MSIKNDALAELTIARDQTRLHAHLLSMDARERFRAIEAQLDAFEWKLLQTGERASESAVASARQLARGVVEFFKEHTPSAALSNAVAEVMNDTVHSCRPSDSLNHAAQIMWEGDCGALPVVNGDGLIVGMITDRDICMASFTQGRHLSALTVEQAMSTAVKTCSADEPISRALEIMEQSKVRRLPVIREGKVQGIVALADVARWVREGHGGRAAACEALAGALAAITEPPRPEAFGPSQAVD